MPDIPIETLQRVIDESEAMAAEARSALDGHWVRSGRQRDLVVEQSLIGVGVAARTRANLAKQLLDTHE